MKTPLERLQDWYLSQCNEDWEHSFGVKIDTLDNPGWILKVDLAETELFDRPFHRMRVDRSETDWIQSESDGSFYEAAGGALNLTEMIEQFLAWAETFESERGQ
jgi:hypothetical protein